MSANYKQLINGKCIESTSKFPVLNPATGKLIDYAPDCSEEQLDYTIQVARNAFPGWSELKIEKRQEYLSIMSEVLKSNLEELKKLLTQEQGKPYEKAKQDILSAIEWLEEGSKLKIPTEVVEDSTERYGIIRHLPIGVVGAIIPWNYPIHLAFVKIVPTLLTGNTLILKPSPYTPLTTLKIGQLLHDKLPPGVLNIISGNDSLGPKMTAHPGIDKISFTGSSSTGKNVMKSCADSVKRVTLELGGNDAAIVLPDVDPNKIAKQLFWSAFENTGQVCIATKRMYIHEDIYDKVKQALIAYIKSIKMGNGCEEGVDLGPLNNKKQYDKIVELINDSKEKGYTFLTGGDIPYLGTEEPQFGYFLPISLIDNPPENSRIVQEEQFGPILPLLKFHDMEDVINRVNSTNYGLGNSIWTNDIDKALDISSRLDSGMVWINESLYSTPLSLFGGHKQSGFGSEGGLLGLLSYTNPRTVYIKKKI